VLAAKAVRGFKQQLLLIEGRVATAKAAAAAALAEAVALQAELVKVRTNANRIRRRVANCEDKLGSLLAIKKRCNEG